MSVEPQKKNDVRASSFHQGRPDCFLRSRNCTDELVSVRRCFEYPLLGLCPICEIVSVTNYIFGCPAGTSTRIGKKDFYKFIEISMEILTGSLGLVPYVAHTRCPYGQSSACVFAFCRDLSLHFAVSLFCSAPGGAVHIR